MRFAELIEKAPAGQHAPLYHWTPLVSLDDVLRWDALGAHEYDPRSGVTAIKNGWLSVSRSQQYRKGRLDETARLVLDGNLVRRDFKIRPYVDWSVVPANDRRGKMTREQSRWEAEEKVFGPIRPLDEYLLKIQVTQEAYDTLIRTKEAYEHHRKEREHRREMFSKGYFKMGPAHKTYPNQYLKFEDVPIEPKKFERILARTAEAYKKPDTTYEDLLVGTNRILDDPKLQIGLTQS